MSHAPALRTFSDYWRCASGIELPAQPAALDPIRLEVGKLTGRAVPEGFDALVDHLRREGYADNDLTERSRGLGPAALARRGYYLLRPLFPVAVRKHLQRAALAGWERIPFPRWPVDTTVDDLMRAAWRDVLVANGTRELPFVWFWPDGRRSCVVVTHDVETAAGRDACGMLMAMEAERGIRSAFEVVPEVRYESSDAFLEAIRNGGCEVCLHGLTHDGHLFTDLSEFRRRAQRMERHALRLGARGFRSPIMYRNPDWIDTLPFAYDMSFPNVAHLDPQRGGCCTVMPFSLGRVLELPLTTTQDYSLQNILRDWSLDLWREQMSRIRARSGLMSFIVHPDYTLEPRARALYAALLDEIAVERDRRGAWAALPSEVEVWWRQRQAMELVDTGDGWSIEGEGSERATIGVARLTEDGVSVWPAAERAGGAERDRGR